MLTICAVFSHNKVWWECSHTGAGRVYISTICLGRVRNIYCYKMLWAPRSTAIVYYTSTTTIQDGWKKPHFYFPLVKHMETTCYVGKNTFCCLRPSNLDVPKIGRTSESREGPSTKAIHVNYLRASACTINFENLSINMILQGCYPFQSFLTLRHSNPCHNLSSRCRGTHRIIHFILTFHLCRGK